MATVKATTRPSRPTIDKVMDNMPPYTGVIEKGGLTNDSRPTVSGRSDAGSIIHVLVDGREVGTAVVKANGTWSFALPQSLSDGEYRLTARASNDAGWSVPSTSYGIVVDVTPPSRPTIEAATEGTQPTLSGRAEAYSTVTVYDGAKVLGTATTGIDGAWMFKLPSGLSNGTHSLTVTAMDPAGNTSVVSAGFDVTIGPVAPPTPTTQAILDEMGRDSGSFNFDRLTNDGTAGRLLSGHLTAALATGEKVQVSTDGGKTWVDASMKSDGTWVAIDSNAHAKDWTVQTRVVNELGMAGKSNAYDVILDATAANAPDSLTFDTATGRVHIGIANSGAASSDTLKLILGNYTFDHKLTAEEIISGSVTVSVPGDIRSALGDAWHAGMKMQVAVIDQAGNSSDWRWANKESSKRLDLDGQDEKTINSLAVDGAVIESVYSNDITNQEVKIGKVSGADGDHGVLQCNGLMKISLDGYSATSVSMRVVGPQKDWGIGTNLVVYAGTSVNFYDENGKFIKTYTVPYSKDCDVDVTWTMPQGKAFSSMVILTGFCSYLEYVGEIEGGSEWQYVNYTNQRITNIFSDIKYDLGSDVWNTGVEPVPEVQNVSVLSGFYSGGYGDDVFNVSDVRYFNSGESGVHGGAGVDTLKLTGANMKLDVTALNSGITSKISSIEIFDLTGTGNNTLKLSLRDVLELGHEDVFRTDGHTQMMVKGNAGDRVELSGMSDLDGGHWTNQGMVAVDGMAYIVYENTALNVELLVQSAVSTQLV